MPHYAVHTPRQAKPELIAHFEAKVKPGLRHQNAVYAAMIKSLDECVGTITAKLEELGIADRTAIFFNSDNGGLIGSTVNVPSRVGKGSAYEGGIHVPLIVKWPGVTKPGSVCREPVISMDYYPTLLEMAGASGDARHNANVDGRSITSLLRDSAAKLDREAIYWHYPHYHQGGATPYSAVRAGDWKLVEFFEDSHVELYNLAEDESEATDLAAAMPERVELLRKQLHAWRESVGAQLPTPNPNYDPAAPAWPVKKPTAKQKAVGE
jgi:arylsulfatase A